eukprot:768682-Hanusia_phi.AAC.2
MIPSTVAHNRRKSVPGQPAAWKLVGPQPPARGPGGNLTQAEWCHPPGLLPSSRFDGPPGGAACPCPPVRAGPRRAGPAGPIRAIRPAGLRLSPPESTGVSDRTIRSDRRTRRDRRYVRTVQRFSVTVVRSTWQLKPSTVNPGVTE